MDWLTTYQRLQTMIGVKLRSISGKTDIEISEVNSDTIKVRSESGMKTRSLDELRRIVSKMTLGQPIHVDSVLFGSGSSRNQPETILANMPDVEWLNLNGRKHIVWTGRNTHGIGTLREVEEFEATQIRTRFRGRGPLTGRRPTTLIIRAKEPRKATELIAAALQESAPEPVPGKSAYRITNGSSEILLIPDQNSATMDFIPVLKVVDRSEAVARLRNLFPDLQSKVLDVEGEIIVVEFPGSGFIAFE
jgi:hypothetical protein